MHAPVKSRVSCFFTDIYLPCYGFRQYNACMCNHRWYWGYTIYGVVTLNLDPRNIRSPQTIISEQPQNIWTHSEKIVPPSLHTSVLALSPGSLLKNGGREPGNIRGKSCQLPAHHHSCNERRMLPLFAMWFNKLSCNIGTILGSSASCLQFRSSSLRHLQLYWVPWHILYI